MESVSGRFFFRGSHVFISAHMFWMVEVRGFVALATTERGEIFHKGITAGQIIATSHDLTPNGGLVRDIPLFQGNLGWWNIIIWPDYRDHYSLSQWLNFKLSGITCLGKIKFKLLSQGSIGWMRLSATHSEGIKLCKCMVIFGGISPWKVRSLGW